MKRDSKILIILIAGAIIYSLLRFNTGKTSDDFAREFIAEAKKSGGYFDLSKQNLLERQIDSLIANYKYSATFFILDTANIMEETKLNYKGKIFFKQGKMSESIDAFTRAIAFGGKFHISFANRAVVYVAVKKYDSAINDYKDISSWNSEYYRPLAETYQKNKQKDSALKYFKLFLTHYPDSISVKQRIEDIENGG